MGAGPKPVATRGDVERRLILAALLVLAGGCARAERRQPEPDFHQARVALGASFVGGQARGLRELLHGDLIVQPPEPDTALRGAAAADEGGFLLERGGWHLGAGEHTFASRYTIRWRDSPSGWKVVLWRWTLFR